MLFGNLFENQVPVFELGQADQRQVLALNGVLDYYDPRQMHSTIAPLECEWRSP